MKRFGQILMVGAAVGGGALMAGADEGTKGISIAPPVPATAPAGELKAEGAAEPLVTLRANQVYTTNALIGYVNSQPMFVGDVLRPIHEELTQLAAQPDQTYTGFRSGARGMIESQMKRQVSDLLIQQAAKSALTDEDKQRLDVYINKMRFDLLQKHGGGQALADQQLRSQGTSVEKEMADRKRRLTVDLYLSKQLYPRIVVTRAMVLDEYEKTLAKWTQEPELELFTITILPSKWLKETAPDGKAVAIQKPTAEQLKNAEAQAQAQAEEILGKIKAGEDWARLAEDYSGDSRAGKFGGKWPPVKKGMLVWEELEKYAFSLPAETVGKPLTVRDTNPALTKVFIVKVGKKKEQRVVSFSEAQEEIRTRLREQQYAQLTNEYMAKLYKDSAVEAVDRMVDVVVESAMARYATKAR